MGCCLSCFAKKPAFGGAGHRLGAAADERRAGGDAAAPPAQYTDEPRKDDRLTDEDRARIREERLAAAEGRMTAQEKKAMRQKKKPAGDAPLRGPNSANTMRWTAG